MLCNEYVTYVLVLPVYSSDEYAGIVILNFFYSDYWDLVFCVWQRRSRDFRCLSATLVKPQPDNQEQKVVP